MTDIMRKVRIVEDGLVFDDTGEKVPISYESIRNKCLEMCRDGNKTLSIIGIVAEAIEELTCCYVIRDTYRQKNFFNSLQEEIVNDTCYQEKKKQKNLEDKKFNDQIKEELRLNQPTNHYKVARYISSRIQSYYILKS